jgi:UDP-N-acetylmuramoyl-tripeptide--D-alanyl-D-alanine ligase
VAVVEIGTNHPGEIAQLCRTLAPTHGVITGIGREHLEFFGSLEGVAEEEGELFKSIAKHAGGMAIVCGDDARVRKASRDVKRKLTYGFKMRSALVRGRRLLVDAEGCASFEFRSPSMKRWRRVRLMIPGRHNAVNALSAAAAGVAFRVAPAAICLALEACQSFTRRMEKMSIGGVTLLDDTYNANPDSALAALQTLALLRTPGKKIAVLADMKELGSHASEAHAEVGKEAAALGIDYLLTYGELARQIHAVAGFPGALHYDQKNVLAEYLVELVRPGDAVLVKGSRGMHMENVVAFLKERLEPSGSA